MRLDEETEDVARQTRQREREGGREKLSPAEEEEEVTYFSFFSVMTCKGRIAEQTR